jgi:hypothetical protein
MLVHRLLERGNGAERQRRHERAGGLGLAVQRLADETAAPSPLASRTDDMPAHAGVEVTA